MEGGYQTRLRVDVDYFWTRSDGSNAISPKYARTSRRSTAGGSQRLRMRMEKLRIPTHHRMIIDIRVVLQDVVKDTELQVFPTSRPARNDRFGNQVAVKQKPHEPVPCNGKPMTRPHTAVANRTSSLWPTARGTNLNQHTRASRPCSHRAATVWRRAP